MREKFLQWWMKYSLIYLGILIALLVLNSMEPTPGGPTQKEWIIMFALSVTPLGALMGQLFTWMFKVAWFIIKLIFQMMTGGRRDR